MKLAIMQPYIFPYVGYFQLLKAVDTFVFFNDVQYKRRSYITRNAILINDKANTFSVPVKKGERDAQINEIQLHEEQFEIWKGKFLKTLTHAYGKAPQFEIVFDLINSIFEVDKPDIFNLTKQSIITTCQYLNMNISFIDSSSLVYDNSGSGEEKILSICKLLQADAYVNAINGKELYNKNTFRENDIELLFLQPSVQKYKQFSETFTSHLSIIDMMMFLAPDEIAEHLDRYQLITN